MRAVDREATVKVMRDHHHFQIGLPSIGCFLHSPQVMLNVR